MIGGGIKIVGNGGCAFQEPPGCKWCLASMPVDGKISVDFREIIDESRLPETARTMPPGSRFGLRVQYSVPFVPYEFTKDLPYELKQGNDSKLYWAPASYRFDGR